MPDRLEAEGDSNIVAVAKVRRLTAGRQGFSGRNGGASTVGVGVDVPIAMVANKLRKILRVRVRLLFASGSPPEPQVALNSTWYPVGRLLVLYIVPDQRFM